MLVHGLGGPAVLAARAGELAGDERAGAVVAQVVVEVAALQHLAARVRVRARHRLLVEQPAGNDDEGCQPRCLGVLLLLVCYYALMVCKFATKNICIYGLLVFLSDGEEGYGQASSMGVFW